jgi:hypothetical protein
MARFIKKDAVLIKEKRPIRNKNNIFLCLPILHKASYRQKVIWRLLATQPLFGYGKNRYKTFPYLSHIINF